MRSLLDLPEPVHLQLQFKKENPKLPPVLKEDEYRFISLPIAKPLGFSGVRTSGSAQGKDGNDTAKVACNTARFKMTFL